ncbi:histidinol-phosphatase [Nitrospirillum pindoramense]|uniref:Histidinol-phosphatase n=1 Tax=Nitrospirillum amazonense TaxID=28077 RepID=A0A560H7W6_9PROT|nr:histidinol-phosphatase [Nitrospirillum amazonense]TWB41754.1 histidinol phosphatase-like enzyme (inositol monophosphatase family) [Nitrospirillum amazonense]
MTTPVPDDLIALAHRMAESAGAVIRRYFRADVEIDAKSNLTPVTIADRQAEEALRAILAAERPDDGILGEELGTHGLDREYVWVLDPIDGTKSFMTGRPIFGTLIGLLRHGRPVLGVIDQPILGERWIGGVGHPTRFNGTPVRTRACPTLAEATVTTTSPDMFKGEEAERFARLKAASRYVVYGSDCYGYAQVANGWLDISVERDLAPWDWAALVPVVEGAGGRMTDWQGRDLVLGAVGEVVASGDVRAHAQALAIMGGGVLP